MVMAHAYSFDFSAPFKPSAGDTALENFRARQSSQSALARQALPAEPGQREGYVLCKSVPDVSAAEVEQAGVEALEVTILWGASVLHVAHLTPPRSFSVGELEGCDFLIPEGKLGAGKLPLIQVDQATVSLIVPENASGELELAQAEKMPMAEACAHAEVVAEVPGARRVPLAAGMRASLSIGDFTFRAAVVNAGKRSKHGIAAAWDRAVVAYFGGAFFVHAALMAGLAAFVPPLGVTDDEDLDLDRLYLMRQYVNAAAEREKTELEQQTQDGPSEREGGTGDRSKGSEGDMGKMTAKAANKHYAMKGDKNNPDPHMAKSALLQELRHHRHAQLGHRRRSQLAHGALGPR
jgi:hypothetical protein